MRDSVDQKTMELGAQSLLVTDPELLACMHTARAPVPGDKLEHQWTPSGIIKDG
jgi:hypothetical protein